MVNSRARPITCLLLHYPCIMCHITKPYPSPLCSYNREITLVPPTSFFRQKQQIEVPSHNTRRRSPSLRHSCNTRRRSPRVLNRPVQGYRPEGVTRDLTTSASPLEPHVCCWVSPAWQYMWEYSMVTVCRGQLSLAPLSTPIVPTGSAFASGQNHTSR